MLNKLMDRFTNVICGEDGCVWTLNIFLFGLAIGATIVYFI